MSETEYYEARMDKIFCRGSLWKHRTLRTLFDPYSYEWNSTDFEKKIEILEQIVASGESLEGLIIDYKQRYKEQKRYDIANLVEDALVKLMEYRMKKTEN